MNQKKVIVYSSPTCSACKAVKEFLTGKGVPYIAKEVTSDNRAADEMLKVTAGVTSVPVIVVDGQPIIGFDQPKLEEALGLS